MDFAERLRKIVEKTGLTRDEFAERVGVSRAQLFNYLGGKNEPPGPVFRAIKAIFPWVNLEWLITGIDAGEAAESTAPYVPSPSKKLINRILDEMTEEARRDVLKYAEEKKLLGELLEERKQPRRVFTEEQREEMRRNAEIKGYRKRGKGNE